ncbi:MAG: cell wall hydrolase [Rhodothermales bacterium]|nr:cell wall hydrolase [Rhodothermales bacterium]
MKNLAASFYSGVILLVAFVSTFVLGDAQSSNRYADVLTNATRTTTEQTLSETPITANPFTLEGPRLDLSHLNSFDGMLSPAGNTVDLVRSAAEFKQMIANLSRLEPLAPETLPSIDSETLWLARCIYSETKRPEEQELVAWVLRNRVETGYRGARSFQEAVLDPYQFSAFNPGTRTRRHYTRLTPTSTAKGWQRALRIAYEVKRMPEELRPFSPETRHFYSEQSMRGGRTPKWAVGKRPVRPARDLLLDARRFRFYERIV